jgi:hypothetical protein
MRILPIAQAYFLAAAVAVAVLVVLDFDGELTPFNESS